MQYELDVKGEFTDIFKTIHKLLLSYPTNQRAKKC